ALGRGLDALLDDIAQETSIDGGTYEPGSGAVYMAIDLISPNPDQPRKYFDETELDELSKSIRAKGVIQPILVRKSPQDSGRYEIVAGERRWRAAQRANIHEIPVVIRELDEKSALEIAIIENVQRSDLNPIEEAFGYNLLMERYGHTQEELAASLGKSRSHIANTLRLLRLPQDVQDLVRAGDLSAGHGRACLGADDPSALAQRATRRNMTVREVENAAKSGRDEPMARFGGGGEPGVSKDANTMLLEGELSATLRMPVTITPKSRDGGEVKIAYRSLDELDALCRLLRGEEQSVLAHG
ncbi:MAG: ParB/RepB/Spo0J family partition protein, partial [Pseudomonadota bacterium]